MLVISPRLSGFCPGVKRAENEIFKFQNNNPGKKICILGPLIHNSNYMNFLKNKGIVEADSEKDLDGCDFVVIRTHGINSTIEKRLSEKFNIIDLTCSKVKNLQLKIQEYSSKGFFIIISGKKNHPEVQGLISYADNYVVIESTDDINNGLFKSLENHQSLFITSQTTASENMLINICSAVHNKFGGTKIIECHNSICSITLDKELEAISLINNTDIAIVIGDKSSSNANKLFNQLKGHFENTVFTDSLSNLLITNIPFSNYKTALIVSSASTPKYIEDEIREFLLKV